MFKSLKNAFQTPSADALRLKLVETTARDLLVAEAHLEDALAARDKYAKRLERLSKETRNTPE